MNWRRLRRELAAGLRDTTPYLLAHHQPGDHRCYVLTVGQRRIRLCARCSGVYPGLVAGVLAWLTGAFASVHLLAVAVLPAFALADWGRAAVREAPGDNRVRTATGFLLGIAYGLAVPLFLTTFDWRLVAVGVAYAGAAGALVARYPDAGWE